MTRNHHSIWGPLWVTSPGRRSLGAAAAVGAFVGAILVASVTSAIEPRLAYAGLFTGSRFTPGTCTSCPAILPPAEFDFSPGTFVAVSWNETTGYGIFAEIGGPDGSGVACPAGERTSGGCGFISLGGTYAFQFIAPDPATEPGYSTEYAVHYFGLQPSTEVLSPG